MEPVTYDVLVIGGGPAGMMAAGRAAELGAKVALVEKNKRTGVKLLMTGGGRCNLANTRMAAGALPEILGKRGRFLYPCISAFGPDEAVAFFEGRGVAVKEEDKGRIFPVSDSARDVLRALSAYMKMGGVRIIQDTPVSGLIAEEGAVIAARTAKGVIRANAFIVCTGGRSYPSTGSTGDGYGWLERLGHTIVSQSPALTPLRVSEAWVADVEGARLADCELCLWAKGKKRASARGECMFTRDGLTGPAALDISSAVGALLTEGAVELTLDLSPDRTLEELDAVFRDAFSAHPNRLAKNCLDGQVPPALAPLLVAMAGLEPGTRVNGLSRAQRRRLVGLLKGLGLTVKGLHGFKRAMVTSGGVALNEVDPKTMRSRLAGNLYLAGELLDIDGPTGGYNLQICWSTGRAAGESAAKHAQKQHV